VKNQISHDSIHRVEPSAKFLSEQRTKVEGDEASIAKTFDSENEEKETMANDVTDTDPLENDKEGQSEREKFQKKNRSEEQRDNSKQPNHFLGGQIFDSEA